MAGHRIAREDTVSSQRSFAGALGYSSEEQTMIDLQEASCAWTLQLPSPLGKRLFYASIDWLDLIGRSPNAYAHRQSGTDDEMLAAAARWRADSTKRFGHLITTPLRGVPVESAELCSEYMAQILGLPRLLCRVYRHYWDVYEVPAGYGDQNLHYLSLAYQLKRYLLRGDELSALDAWLRDNGLLETRPDAWPPSQRT